MIGSLRGKITFKSEKFILIETGGVGYKVNISPDTLTKVPLNSEVSLFIHTHIREDMFDLYGFLDRQELEFFEMLINVSGIGPKALATYRTLLRFQALVRKPLRR